MTQKQRQDNIQDKQQIKALKTLPASDVHNAESKSTSVQYFMQKQQHQATVATTTIIPLCTTGGMAGTSMSSTAPAKVLPALQDTNSTASAEVLPAPRRYRSNNCYS
jgi:hypothetical protein